MRIGIPKEIEPGETRVAIDPKAVVALKMKNHEIVVESGAGVRSSFGDDQYEKAGIVLACPGHMHCNGLCKAGPHVVLGGKCMCPPTPGTDYYEKVVTGIGAPPRQTATAPAKP